MNDKTEAQIRSEIKQYLHTTGWIVVDFSQHRRTTIQWKNWVDLEAFRLGVTLLMEAKTRTGKRTPGQAEFAENLKPHLGMHLVYCVPRCVEDVRQALKDALVQGLI